MSDIKLERAWGMPNKNKIATITNDLTKAKSLQHL